MSVIRPLFIIALLVGVSPLRAAGQTECAAIEGWAAGFDKRDRVRVAPKIDMPSLLQEESLSSLFGRPILGWSEKKFRTVEAQLNRCRKQASKRGDREMATSLKEVRAEIGRVADQAWDYQQAVNRVQQAVQQLDAQPPSEELVLAMGLAINALHLTDIRKQAEALPPQQQRLLQSIVIGADFMPEKAAMRFAGYLEKLQTEVRHKVEKLAAFRPESELTPEERIAERKRARRVLQETRAKIDTASADDEGLILLEGMIEMPELLRVPDDEKQAFLAQVYARHDELSRILRQTREQESRHLAGERLDRLYRMNSDKLRDLGVLFAYRDRVHQEMGQSGQRQAAQAFEDGFAVYVEQVAARLMPDFKAALEGIPADSSGLARLDRAVADLTGIPDRSPYLDSFHALVEKRREALRKEIPR